MSARAELPALDAAGAARVARLERAYLDVDARMRGLPVHNGRMRVEALGFHAFEHGILGIMITPWVIHAALLAEPPRAAGGTRTLELPSGRYPFVGAALGSFGVVETCSLMSPVLQLADQSAARAFAAVALHALLEACPAPEPARAPAVSRRGVLGLERER